MSRDPETDEERVEFARHHMQELLDRADWEAGGEKAVLDSVGVPHQSVYVQAEDLREVGRFELRLPPHALPLPGWLQKSLARHWVYVHRDGRMFALGMAKRAELRARGSTSVNALVVEPGKGS